MDIKPIKTDADYRAALEEIETLMSENYFYDCRPNPSQGQVESEGKDQVTIFDYVDASLPMLQRMFVKREKGYKIMGYQISFSEITLS